MSASEAGAVVGPERPRDEAFGSELRGDRGSRRKASRVGIAERNRLVVDNLRLARFLARKYVGRGVEIDDLIAEADLGLIRAAELFDPEKGKFSTFAYHHILQKLRLVCMVHGHGAVLLPVSVTEKTAADRDAAFSRPVVRLDRTLPDSSTTYAELIPDESSPPPDSGIDSLLSGTAVATALCALPPRWAQMVIDVYGLDDGEQKTLEAVGEKHGVTRERVRQIVQKAFEKMRPRLVSVRP